MTPGREFYDRHIKLLEQQDVDALVARQYEDNAVLVGFDFTVRGKEALHKHLTAYLKQLGSLKLQSTDKFTETEESIFFEATVETAHGTAKVYDVFMLSRDHKATYQFTGLISFTSFEA